MRHILELWKHIFHETSNISFNIEKPVSRWRCFVLLNQAVAQSCKLNRLGETVLETRIHVWEDGSPPQISHEVAHPRCAKEYVIGAREKFSSLDGLSCWHTSLFVGVLPTKRD